MSARSRTTSFSTPWCKPSCRSWDASRPKTSRSSVLGRFELSFIFESDAAAGLMPVVHPTLPPAIGPSAPFQQEPVYPRPARQDPARLRFRRDVLGEAMEAFTQPSRHRHGQRDGLRRVSLLAVTLGDAMSLQQRLAIPLAVVRAAVRGSPHPGRKTRARGHAFRFAAPGCDL